MVAIPPWRSISERISSCLRLSKLHTRSGREELSVAAGFEVEVMRGKILGACQNRDEKVDWEA